MNNKQINLLVDAVKLLLIMAITLAVIAAIIFSVSDDPLNALYNFFVGPFLSMRRIGNIVEGACPLTFTAMAVMLIFKAGQFSMISEGSFFIGTGVAMSTSLAVPMPTGLHALVALLGAALAGAFIAFIPAILKKTWDVSEVVTSIMLNYVCEFFVIYLVTYHFKETSSSSLASWELAPTSLLPKIVPGTNIHLGVILALLLCVGCWVLTNRSRFGYQLRLTGSNPSFSHYAGIKETGVMVGAQVIAGTIAGMGGGVELLGMYNRFKWTTSPGFGWTGIVVALLAKDNPLLIPLSACFFSYINTGANIMAMNSDVSNDVAQIIQGVIMMLIVSGALLQRWRQKLVVRAAEKEQAEAAAVSASVEA
ncbi:ABC transporter permease [Olsenella phocaeensis]|uniref:ABC transporter permease n=1 Tax=Olsenella phocaeensis TaxID=1852385 RepID=UPI0026DAB1E9|nr:ABC transporter permease [uncultured Olsenella sp.]